MIVPGIAGLSVMSATFTSLAYNLTTLRERGILKRLRGTPLPTVGLPRGARPPTRVANAVLQLALVIVAGHLAARRHLAGGLGRRAGVHRRGRRSASRSLGVALSHAIPNPESAPAYVNAVFLPQILIAGVFYDDQSAPRVIRDIAEVLPLKHLIDGLSGAMIHGEGVGDHLTALLVLAVWGAVGRSSRSAASPGRRAARAERTRSGVRTWAEMSASHQAIGYVRADGRGELRAAARGDPGVVRQARRRAADRRPRRPGDHRPALTLGAAAARRRARGPARGGAAADLATTSPTSRRCCAGSSGPGGRWPRSTSGSTRRPRPAGSRRPPSRPSPATSASGRRAGRFGAARRAAGPPSPTSRRSMRGSAGCASAA